MAYRVSKQRFGELVEEALAEVPEPFAGYLEEVVVEVRQRPSEKQAKRLGTRRVDRHKGARRSHADGRVGQLEAMFDGVLCSWIALAG